MGGWGPSGFEEKLSRFAGVYTTCVEIDIVHRPFAGKWAILVCHPRLTVVAITVIGSSGLITVATYCSYTASGCL